MARQMVRCIDGHVFDYSRHNSCPVCGAEVHLGPNSASVTKGISATDDGSAVNPKPENLISPASVSPHIPTVPTQSTAMRLGRLLLVMGFGSIMGAAAIIYFFKIRQTPHPTPKTASSSIPKHHSVAVRAATGHRAVHPSSFRTAKSPPAKAAKHIKAVALKVSQTMPASIHPAKLVHSSLVLHTHLSVANIQRDVNIFQQRLPLAGKVSQRVIALIPFCAGGDLFEGIMKSPGMILMDKLAFRQGVAAAGHDLGLAYTPAGNNIMLPHAGLSRAARWYQRGADAKDPASAYFFLLTLSKMNDPSVFLTYKKTFLTRLARFAYTNDDKYFMNIYNMAPDPMDPFIQQLHNFANLPANKAPSTLTQYYENNFQNNPKQVLAILRKFNKLDFPRASYLLGLSYIQGSIVPQNPAKAAHYFIKSAVIAGYRNAFAFAPAAILKEPHPNYYQAAILALLARTRYPLVTNPHDKPQYMQHKAIRHLNITQLANVQQLRTFFWDLNKYTFQH